MTTVYEWSERTSKTKPPPSAAQRLRRVFHIDIAYRDVGKGREQDAVASKPAANAVARSRS